MAGAYRGITATKAITRDRYWGHQARVAMSGKDQDIEEIMLVARMLGIDPAEMYEGDTVGDVVIGQTLIRSVTGIGNEESLVGDARMKLWKAALDDPNAQITFEMNATKEQAMHFALHNHRLQDEQEFEFGPRLVEEFRQTEVGDVLCRELNLPYKTFYLRFVGLEGKTFEGLPLDGFLIWQSLEEGMYIYPLSATPLKAWGTLDEPGRCTYAQMTVQNLKRPDEPFVEVARDIVDELAGMAQTVRSGHLEATPEWIAAVADNHDRAKDIVLSQYTEWMRLIVNALLTIDAGGIEATRSYPEGAPENLVEKATSGRPGARKAEQKLRAAGYVTLRRYEVPRQCAIADGGDRSVSPHWRRGHWRRQHYGVGNAFTRRVRIAPVMVMAHAGDASTRKGYRIPAGDGGGN